MNSGLMGYCIDNPFCYPTGVVVRDRVLPDFILSLDSIARIRSVSALRIIIL
jgi:hypothetical protein